MIASRMAWRGTVLRNASRTFGSAKTPVLLCAGNEAPDTSALGIPTVEKRASRDEIVSAVRFVAKS